MVWKKSKHFLVGGNNTHKKLQKKNLFSVLTGSTKQQNKWLLTLIYPLALHTLLNTLPPSLAVLAMVNFWEGAYISDLSLGNNKQKKQFTSHEDIN